MLLNFMTGSWSHIKPTLYMKTNNLYRAILMIAIITIAFSCKKNTTDSADGSTATDLQTQADDQSQISNEDEILNDDANAALYSQPAVSGNSIITEGSASIAVNSVSQSTTDVPPPICDATIALDSTADARTLTITYNGQSCWGNRTRSGTVVISIPKNTFWKEAGAAVTVSIQNLKITRLRDMKSITLNGTKTYTNVSGGKITDLPNLTSVTHTITGTLTISFDNNTQRVWNVAKQRVFTYDNGLVITTTGTHSDDSNSGIAEWGTNRFGVGFASLITQPKVIQPETVSSGW